MFWGLNLKANRKYTQTTTKSFHISQAALDSSSSQGGPIQIFLTHEEQKFLICTLRKETCEQATLDLNFAEGDEVSFQSQGSGNVTLSGYLIENDPNFLDGDEAEDSETEELKGDLRAALLNKHAKKGKSDINAAAAAKLEDEEESDADVDGEDSDDDDEDDEEVEEEGEDEDEEDEDDDGSDSDGEEIYQPKTKQAKLDKAHKQANGVVKDAAEKKIKKDKKGKKEKKEDQQKQNQQKAGGEKVLSGGVKVEDIRIGNGPEAKTGKRAIVYYEGRLKSNNKVFDSHKQGAGFKFGIGRGEVIKGWEVGVAGMKVGGRRRITCPPHMAYGSRGSPPTIPPNSTLVFDIELKGVN